MMSLNDSIVLLCNGMDTAWILYNEERKDEKELQPETN